MDKDANIDTNCISRRNFKTFLVNFFPRLYQTFGNSFELFGITKVLTH